MARTKKQSVLKQLYFRSFIILVVIPLLVVFIGAFSIVSYLIRAASIETIDAFQESVASVLQTDVRTASLQLSHFVYVNDGEFPAMAAQVYDSAGTVQYYTTSQQLERAFHTAMTPSEDILGGMFYMRDGGSIYMNKEIMLTSSEVRAASWYTAAQASPNQVRIGGYDTSRVRLTYPGQKNNVFVLVTAMALDRSVDKSNQIDLMAFFTATQAGDVIRRARGRSELGSTVLLDETGQVLYGDFGNDALRDFFSQHAGEFTPGSKSLRAPLRPDGSTAGFLFRTRSIPDTGWTVVTFVEERLLTQGFHMVGGLLLLVVALLLGLFCVFSLYFLNAIVVPVQTVVQGMRQLENNNLDVQVQPSGHQEIRDLMDSFNQMVLSLKNMLAINAEAQRRKHTAEMQALQSQINPHFVVNSLNSIRFMAQVAGYDGIRDMAAAFSVQNFPQVAQRYGGEVRERMQRPMLELVRQIPRLSNHGVIRAIDPSYYELYYRVSDPLRVQSTVDLAVRQIQHVWKDMLNLEVAVGVSEMIPHTEAVQAARQCAGLCALAQLRGPGSICTQWRYGALAGLCAREAPACAPLLDALWGDNPQELQREAAAWFVGLRGESGESHTGRCAALLAGLSHRLAQYGQSLGAILPEQPDLLGALQQMESARERELWLHGILRRVRTACTAGASQAQPDVMERARAFIRDNFVNPELTLKTVADYVGFNEKYFSTRFAKECGCTFISYLNGLRIERAGQLLLQTDMKIYEVCEAVGYHNVEHFNHVFKKKTGVTPKIYRQSGENI